MSSAVAFPFTERDYSRRARKRRPAVCKINYRPKHEIEETPSAHAVREQLSKILQSDGFLRAERMRSFLEFLVGERLAGRASRICEYSIAVSVFGRGESFEPGLDPIVRNDARRLRQKLLEYYQRSHDGSRDEIVIDVPKGGYVPVFRSVSDPGVKKTAPRYRLVISVIRMADGAETSTREYEFHGGENVEVQLELTTANARRNRN